MRMYECGNNQQIDKSTNLPTIAQALYVANGVTCVLVFVVLVFVCRAAAGATHIIIQLSIHNYVLSSLSFRISLRQ